MSTKATITNNVDVPTLKKTIGKLQQDPGLAQFHFHIRNEWLQSGPGHSRNTIESFYGTREEVPHEQTMHVEADEPTMLLSKDEAPNPVELLLSALASCLTGSMVYHAAARGIEIEELRSEVEGDIDLRGFLGVSDKVRKGYQNIRVTFHVKSDATPEQLKECASFSPVYDVTCNGTDVELNVQKM